MCSVYGVGGDGSSNAREHPPGTLQGRREEGGTVCGRGGEGPMRDRRRTVEVMCVWGNL